MRLARLAACAVALALSACNALTLNSTTASSLLSASPGPGPGLASSTSAPLLANAKYFAIVLQNVGQNGPVDVGNITAISQSRYDIVTIDEISTYNSSSRLSASSIVNQMHATAGTNVPRKIVLGYVDVGEAENYRTYWQQGWTIANPPFILATDPNGFTNKFAVNYADPRWWAIVFGSQTALVDQAIADGFDGVFLDNVGAYANPVVAAADKNAQGDMVTLLAAISVYAKAKSPNFLIVADSGAGLTNDSRLTAAIDADSEESLFFGSSAGQQGDVQTAQATRSATLTLLQRIQALNKPVISIDYATDPNNAQLAYAGGAANRLIEYVTTRALSQLSATPPFAVNTSGAHRNLSLP